MGWTRSRAPSIRVRRKKRNACPSFRKYSAAVRVVGHRPPNRMNVKAEPRRNRTGRERRPLLVFRPSFPGIARVRTDAGQRFSRRRGRYTYVRLAAPKGGREFGCQTRFPFNDPVRSLPNFPERSFSKPPHDSLARVRPLCLGSFRSDSAPVGNIYTRGHLVNDEFRLLCLFHSYGRVNTKRIRPTRTYFFRPVFRTRQFRGRIFDIRYFAQDDNCQPDGDRNLARRSKFVVFVFQLKFVSK